MTTKFFNSLKVILFFTAIVTFFAGCLATPGSLSFRPLIVSLITMSLGLLVGYCAPTTTTDPGPTVTLGVDKATIAEADAGIATFTATLSEAAADDVTVTLAFSGSATDAADYTKSAATITIPAGSTMGSITVTVVNDTLPETGDNETIVVDIDTVTNAVEDLTQQASVGIVDNDPVAPASPTVTLAVSPATIVEAAGTATFTATLSNTTTATVDIALAISGTATDGVDFSKSAATISIPAGSTTGSVTVTAIDDTSYEPGVNETVIADISTVTNGTENGTQTASTAIVDNDTAPTVTLGVSPATILEATGTATFTATLSNTTTVAVDVALAISGTATDGVDFSKSGTTISIPAGSTTGSVTVTAIDDTSYEPGGNETMIADISAVTNGTENGIQTASTAIVDNDPNPNPDWIQDAYLKATNAEAYDDFGRFVSISGNFMAVSAHGEDNSNTAIQNTDNTNPALDNALAIDSGAVYVFKRDAVSGNWSQDAYLKASNAEAGDYFGRFVSISGDFIAVGAHWEDNSNTAIQNGDNFAFTPGTNDNGVASYSGAAYVFKRDAATGDWSQDAYLKASNAQTYDNFGNSVSISGDFIAMGAYSEGNSNTAIQNIDNANPALDNALALYSGAVYVFKRDAATGDWSQDAYLKASNAEAVDSFGTSVSISGEFIAVGATSEDNSNTAIQNADDTNPVLDNALASYSGAVYVFKRNTTTGDWSQDAYLKATNAQASDRFGYPVSISGDLIAVGAFGEDNSNTAIQNTDNTNPTLDNATAIDSGAVYVFKRDAATGDWSQDAYLKASNAQAYDNFGFSVSISGGFIVVGASSEDNSNTAIQNADNTNPVLDDAATPSSGAVYVYKRDAATGNWIQDAYIKASNAETADSFGSSVSVSGNFIAVGAKMEDNSNTAIQNADSTNPVADDALAKDSGAVYVYKAQ